MIALTLLLVTAVAQPSSTPSATVQGEGVRVEFDAGLRSRIVATWKGEEAIGPFTDSEVLRTARGELTGFMLVDRSESDVADDLGSGHRVTLRGRHEHLLKQVEVTSYPNRPNWLFFRVTYTNEGDKPIAFNGF